MKRSEDVECVLVPAVPSATCPRCGKLVTLEPSFTGTIRGACRHYDHAELIEKQPYIAFRKPRKAEGQQHEHKQAKSGT